MILLQRENSIYFMGDRPSQSEIFEFLSFISLFKEKGNSITGTTNADEDIPATLIIQMHELKPELFEELICLLELD